MYKPLPHDGLAMEVECIHCNDTGKIYVTGSPTVYNCFHCKKKAEPTAEFGKTKSAANIEELHEHLKDVCASGLERFIDSWIDTHKNEHITHRMLAQAVIEFLRSKAEGLKKEALCRDQDYYNGIDDLIRECEK